MKLQIRHILTIFVLILNYGQLNAAVFPVFDGNSSGIFSNAVGGTNVNITGQSVLWGDAVFLSTQSSLTYVGNNPFAISNSDPFNLGSLEYSNTVIDMGTGISNVDLTINLDFINPAIGAFDFIVDLAIDNTPNTGSGSSNSDTVTFSPISSFPSFLGNIDNINYFFTILGFQDQNGAIVDSFTQLEGTRDTVDLFGQITAVNPIPVPATFWLILTAFFGLFVFNRRKLLIVSSD